MKTLCIVLALMIAVPLFAHPPKTVDLEYDPDSSVLTVNITHNVKDATKHFIYKVVVELNGDKIIEQTFKRQVDNDMQKAIYEIIDASQGDKIAVTAYCNISGKKMVELVVPPATSIKE
jgi:desulfoferrodoxin (superoxide reductase-like protein)